MNKPKQDLFLSILVAVGILFLIWVGVLLVYVFE
jgi:hypothetical protein